MRFLLMFSIAFVFCSTLFSNEVDLVVMGLKNQGLRPNDLVIVSCSGKSGSCTLEASFKNIGLETYRVHNLRPEMYEFILKREADGNILLIDSIRDVISRKIASFFQNITSHINLSQSEILARYKKTPRTFLRFLQGEFDKKIEVIANYRTSQGWKQFNYNCITDEVFDFQKKYQLKKIGNLYFVNLRFQDIKDWEKIIKSIDIPIDLRGFKIISANQGQNKWYNDIYRDFLVNFTLTQAQFNLILSNFAEELAHFYTPEEFNAFVDKWTPYIRN